MNTAHLPDPSFCNNAVLRRAMRQMGQLYDDVLAPCGLRGPQYGLMVQSRFMQGPTMREMAQALVMDLSALGHSLKPLVRDGAPAAAHTLARTIADFCDQDRLSRAA